MCRWTKHIHAPSSAVTAPSADQDRPQRGGVRAERAGEDHPVEPRHGVDDRARPSRPENSTHTGIGATAWASASQKCSGTTAALVRKPSEQQHHRDDHQRVGVVAVERRADLRHVERAGAGVQQRHAR